MHGCRAVPFDIETVGTQRAKERVETTNYKAPSNYKDPAKIAAYVEEKRAEELKKLGLQWWTAKVICIVAKGKGGNQVFFGDDEEILLAKFADFLDREDGILSDIQLVGKNSKNFDQPFLIGRYMANNMPIPRQLVITSEPRDIDEIFGYGSRAMTGKLDDYAFGIGMQGKTANGASMQTMYEATLLDEANWQTICEYCCHDVDITAEILRRGTNIRRRTLTGIEGKL